MQILDTRMVCLDNVYPNRSMNILSFFKIIWNPSRVTADLEFSLPARKNKIRAISVTKQRGQMFIFKRWCLAPCDGLQLQYNGNMKTATIPPIRVAPEFRAEVEGVLEQGETLSEFVENAVRQTVLKRKYQAEFLRRGVAAIEETRRAGAGIAAEVVVAKLEAKLASARRTQ